jgi:hypothetical protein
MTTQQNTIAVVGCDRRRRRRSGISENKYEQDDEQQQKTAADIHFELLGSRRPTEVKR